MHHDNVTEHQRVGVLRGEKNKRGVPREQKHVKPKRWIKKEMRSDGEEKSQMKKRSRS